MATSPLRQPALPFDATPRVSDAVQGPAPFDAVSPHAGAATAVAVAQAPVTLPSVAYVRHPRAKRYLIRVRRDGSVRATIPRGGSRREAVRFVEAQRQWIAEQQAVVAQRRAARPALPAAEIAALRRKAARELPARLLQLAAQFGLTVQRVSIRNQRWRWGSCSQRAHICLNWRLVTMPDWVRDYVLIHELMHLRRMDHSPAFWKFVAAACPGYEDARRWLRDHGQGLTED